MSALPEHGQHVEDTDPPFIPDPRRVVSVRRNLSFFPSTTLNQSVLTSSWNPFTINSPLPGGYSIYNRNVDVYIPLQLTFRLQYSLKIGTPLYQIRCFILYDRFPNENLSSPPPPPTLGTLFEQPVGSVPTLCSISLQDPFDRYMVLYDKVFSLDSNHPRHFQNEDLQFPSSLLIVQNSKDSTGVTLVRGRFYIGWLPDIVNPTYGVDVNGSILFLTAPKFTS